MPAVGRRTVLKLVGGVPSKKNEWKRAKGGGIYFDDPNTPAMLTSLQMQAQSAWRKTSAVTAKRPQISMLFVIQTKSPDPDNMQTTILDLLKKAGVIDDDKASALTPPLVCNWEIRAKCDPHTFVEIQESA